MKESATQKTTSPESTREPGKLPYRRPALRVFGAVKDLTKGQSGSGMDSARKSMIPPGQGSDRGIKENIVRVGDHPLGIGLYLFDYKPQYREICGQGRRFGVMADEVEAIMPEAVSVHPRGFKQVDYAMLGICHTVQ